MKCLISGISGQDAPFLSKFLLKKGYEVYGTYRRLSTPNFKNLEKLGIKDEVNLLSVDMTDTTSIMEALRKVKPDEVYNLAAMSFVEASFDQPVATGNVTGLGALRILEAIRQIKPDIRFYQASTSEMFGTSPAPQNENTVFNPISPYAIAKLYAHHTTKVYRNGYGLFACNGISFNHESELRGEEFVTRKITKAVAEITTGKRKSLSLGNLEAKRDWGYAPDYVESMWKMLQHNEPDDYVIATGESHSVREFADLAFKTVGMDYRDFVKTDKKFLRPIDIENLCGDSSKAKRVLNWEPKTSFKELVEKMVKNDIEEIQ